LNRGNDAWGLDSAATCELTTPGEQVVRYCRYGPADGVPVVSLPGTPGTRWERPDVIGAIEQAGLRVVVPDRPGYGGSTRQPGRTAADVAGDVRLIAEAQGWRQFAVTGFSGGGSHAMACAALLAGRVTCCAVIPAESARQYGHRETGHRGSGGCLLAR
jgi:pimeloyl-ACP methyl ester carboxylesterase